MKRAEIEKAMKDGALLVIQDKADGSVYCCIRENRVRFRRSRRIRFDQYTHQLDQGHLSLIESRRVNGYDHCEYVWRVSP